MFDIHKRLVNQNTWAGKTHHFFYIVPLWFGIAVGGAFAARWFLVAVPTGFEPFVRITQ